MMPGKNLLTRNVFICWFGRVLPAWLACAAALACPAATDVPQRPNIVFILVDDLRWDGLGCMGHPYAKTPNIDRIAKEGALFRNFFISIPLCSPSRGSFLTGQYPHIHKVIDNTDHSRLSHQLVTFPKLMHDAGYETAFIGKWHMGLDDSPRPGFDRWVGFKGQGVYNDPTLNVDGKIEKTNGYITDILNGYAVDFINSDHKKPFLLYLAHKAVHGPFTAAERHKSLYADAVFKPAASANDSLEDKPALKRPAVGNDPEKASAPKKGKKAGSGAGTIERNQLRALAAVDEGVGQLFEALQKTGHLNDTLVVFTSDNGFFWGEHGLSDKRWAYDESIRDPLLMRYPRLVKPGRVLEQFVLNIDLAPTFLELAGAPVPKSIQGRSILSILNDPKASWRNSFMTEYFQEKQYPQTPTWQAVRTSRWKYIRYQDSSGLDELYDLQKDPYELKNLVHDALAQSALKDAQRELERLETDLGFSRTQTNTNERSVPPL